MTIVDFLLLFALLIALSMALPLYLGNRALKKTLARERRESEASLLAAQEENRCLQGTIASLQSLWMVGQYRRGDTPNVVWDLQGVFSSKEAAIAACKEKNWFIAPLSLDAELPEETEVMPDVEWPLLEEAP